VDGAKELLAVLEERDFDGLTNEAGATKVFGNLHQLVAIWQRGRHVGVVNCDFLAVKGVEDGFVVCESFVSLGNTAILVDNQAGATIRAFAGLCEFLQAYILVTSAISESELRCPRTYHKLQNTRRKIIRRQMRELNHPADLDARALRTVVQLRGMRLSEHVRK
jgi:hypothetical protein